MSYTKYVMRDDDVFALVSKMTGVEHSSLASLLGNANRITHAGFLYANDDGKLDSYGKSYSTGKESSPEDGPVILAAINRGDVFIVEHIAAGFFYASNHPNFRTTDGVKVATLDLLKEFRILERD